MYIVDKYNKETSITIKVDRARYDLKEETCKNNIVCAEILEKVPRIESSAS